jgi:hypothetical protein
VTYKEEFLRDRSMGCDKVVYTRYNEETTEAESEKGRNGSTCVLVQVVARVIYRFENTGREVCVRYMCGQREAIE